MNIIITLPRHLIDEICAGRKTIEVRKSFPKKIIIGKDGVFIIEKGTKNVICFCMISWILPAKKSIHTFNVFKKEIRIDKTWWLKYVGLAKKIYFWSFSDVYKFDQQVNFETALGIKRAPQSFVYTPIRLWQKIVEGYTKGTVKKEKVVIFYAPKGEYIK